MRQAGTAPATGATIYCPISLWCAVIYKLLALCTANTLLRVNVRLVLRSDLCWIYCAIYGCVRNSEFRSIRVAMSVRLRVSLMRCGLCVSISTDRNSMSLRRLRVDQRRGPKPACPELVRHLDDQSIMRSFACITYHFCDSNLCPPSITFCYYYCAEEHCVISLCWMVIDACFNHYLTTFYPLNH